MPETFAVDAPSLTSIKDKVILVTGGSSGIGLATTQLLLSLSPANRVAILDRAVPPNSLTSSVSQDRLLFHQCDVTSWAAQRAGFEATVATFGRLDAVVANVGINERGLQFFNDELDEYGKLKEPDRSVIDVPFTANADTVKLAIHYLRSNDQGGSIAIVSSFAGYMGNAGAPFYNAAKHAIVGLFRSLKSETPKLGIAISVVAPALTETPMLARGTSSLEENADNFAKMSASGVAVNRVESVALAIGYLINEGPRSNGKSILVQGDKMVDLERGYAKSRETLMGSEMLQILKKGLGVELYPRIKVSSKI
ncbi:hypothetical protein AB5N19_10708 [Seiridium cardinale]